MTHWRNSNQSTGQHSSSPGRSLAGRQPSAAPSFIPEPTFKRGKLSQALIDIGASLVVGIACGAGVAIVIFLLVLMFTRS